MRKPHLQSVLSALVCASALACMGAWENVKNHPPTLPVTRLRAEPYSFTYNSGLRDADRRVIRDESSWRTTWSAIWATSMPLPALRLVDFTREMVVVAALGERNTGGYSIFVDSAQMSTTSDRITIWIRTVAPGPHCGTTQALTQPVDVALLPRFDVEVEFRDVAIVADC